ncbi:hypothetical protein, partial [Salmonella enterica]|uniref:hypothetical protein n=1 Tax=Salmonella enterica TaxID=28901 RepID=UPI000A878814
YLEVLRVKAPVCKRGAIIGCGGGGVVQAQCLVRCAEFTGQTISVCFTRGGIDTRPEYDRGRWAEEPSAGP